MAPRAHIIRGETPIGARDATVADSLAAELNSLIAETGATSVLAVTALSQMCSYGSGVIQGYQQPTIVVLDVPELSDATPQPTTSSSNGDDDR